MLKFVAIGLCAATAVTSFAATGQTDQSAVPPVPAQSTKQLVESPWKNLKNKGNLATGKAGATVERTRKNVEHVRKRTTNPTEALKPRLNNVADPLKPQ